MTTPTAPFGGVLTAMVTPFDHDGKLDLPGAQKLVKWLLANGNDGVVIAGTTGEAPALSHDEQGQLIAAAVEAADGAPIIAGAGSNNTSAAVDLTERAQAAGATGILSVAPYYNRPNQGGLARHFTAVANSTDLPVIIYDIPVRTGRKVETATLLELFHGVSNITALKDAAGSPDETGRVIADGPDGLAVYSGDDSMTLPLLAVGAVGVIGVATHWTGAEHQAMLAAWNSGDVAEARRINQSLIPSYDFETGNEAPNPIPTKAMMRVLGLPGGPCRAPMDDEPDFVAGDARTVIAGTALAAQAAASAAAGTE